MIPNSNSNPPYVVAPGNIPKVLQKIIEATTPERFTQDFLSTKIGMSGGSAAALIPFLKRIGFLASDGTPTDIYKRFRNEFERGTACAEALKKGYHLFYEANEYAHDLSDAKLKGLIVQLTGLEEKSKVAQCIIASFKALKSFCSFDENDLSDATPTTTQTTETPGLQTPQTPIPTNTITEPTIQGSTGVGLNLAYTINLNLPATDDITVFNAIFKSLKENLLKEQ